MKLNDAPEFSLLQEGYKRAFCVSVLPCLLHFVLLLWFLCLLCKRSIFSHHGLEQRAE